MIEEEQSCFLGVRKIQLLKKSNRVVEIDVIRSISALWIVGIWHFSEYVSDIGAWIDDEFYIQRTFGVLMIFNMISGFLTGRHQLRSLKEALLYIAHRLLRLYPLYFIACVGFFALGLCAKSLFVRAVLLISVFTADTPPTLWFLNMTIVFDIIIVLLLTIKKYVAIIVIWGGYSKRSTYGW